MKSGWMYLIVGIIVCLTLLLVIVFNWQASLYVLGGIVLFYMLLVGVWTFTVIKGAGGGGP